MNMIVLMIAMVIAALAFTKCNPATVVEEKVAEKCQNLGHAAGTPAYESCMKEHGQRFEETKREALKQADITKQAIDEQKKMMQQINQQP
jgi:hypothetical protein